MDRTDATADVPIRSREKPSIPVKVIRQVNKWFQAQPAEGFWMRHGAKFIQFLRQATKPAPAGPKVFRPGCNLAARPECGICYGPSAGSRIMLNPARYATVDEGHAVNLIGSLSPGC